VASLAGHPCFCLGVVLFTDSNPWRFFNDASREPRLEPTSRGWSAAFAPLAGTLSTRPLRRPSLVRQAHCLMVSGAFYLRLRGPSSRSTLHVCAFIATLNPVVIPAHLFWVLFYRFGFIARGVHRLQRYAWLAATRLGMMFLL